MSELASGRTDKLAGDFEDVDQRKWIARAVVSAAKAHVAFGLPMREAQTSERNLAGKAELGPEKDWQR